jgi:hypothetical protein
MTDAEADALDELLTRTTPTLGPNGTGFLSRNGFIVGSLAADTAEYLAPVRRRPTKPKPR